MSKYIVITSDNITEYFDCFKAAEKFVRMFGDDSWRIYKLVYYRGKLVN